MKTEKNFSVKPLIAAIALAGASAHIQAQPGISIGAGFNASASASVSSAFPALDVNHAVNTGYSTTVDVAFPSDTSSVDSLINEVRSGSDNSESLPGLTDMGGQEMPELEGLGGEASASLLTETASEVTGRIQGSGIEALASSVTSASSEISGKLQDSGNSSPVDDNESSNPEDSEESATEESDVSDEVAENSAEQPSLPDPTQQEANIPSVEATGSIVSDIAADASAQVTGIGDNSSSLEAMASSTFGTAYELTASLMDSQPEQPSLPVSEGDASEPSDEIADGSDQSPSLPDPTENKPDIPSADVQGSVVSDIVADASAKVSGAGESGPALEAVVSGASSTTAELTASLQNSQPDVPSQEQPDTDTTEEQAQNGQDVVEGTAQQVSDAAESQPEPGSNAPEAGDVELAAAIENRNKADFFATMYH